MIIGVDATCWANGRGYGRFARELMAALTALAPEHTFVCFGDRRSFDAWPHRRENVRFIDVPLSASPTEAAAADSYRSPLDLLRMTRAVWRERIDVFFSLTVYTYFPLPPGLPAVVTIHDTIAERFPELTLPSRRARLFWWCKVRLATLQARTILTISDYSARSITEVLGVPPSRIRVSSAAPAEAYHPCEPHGIAAAARHVGLPGDAGWFVYVGGFNPHKRVDLILRAHAVLAATSSSPPHLLLVGPREGDVFHREVERLDALVAELRTGALVHWLGFVPDDALRPLLAGATALLLPSEAEGFGLPAVEAAACGAPVVATTESPLPMLLQDGGFFVAPGDSEALESAMRRLHEDPELRRVMGRAASARAAALTWTASARCTLAALRDSAN
jgi:glycosyltransferase involved in cell wall biosynthesis